MIIVACAFTLWCARELRRFGVIGPGYIEHDSVKHGGIAVTIFQERYDDRLFFFTGLRVEQGNQEEQFHIGHDDIRHLNDYLVERGSGADIYKEGKFFATYVYATNSMTFPNGMAIKGEWYPKK